jgi:hypothetical protein
MNVTCSNNNQCPNGIFDSKCVFYEGQALSTIGVSTNDTIETVIQKINTFLQDFDPSGAYVPLTRELTINGVTYDLSQNRTWNIVAGDTFDSNVTFTLPAGESFGKYTNGETAPWAGLTAVEAILDAAIAYIDPVFTSFSVSGQSTTIEVGTTLSGSKTFTWGIAVNSGTVPTIDIYDITAGSTLVSGTTNDGSQAATITTIQLNSNGATQSWRGIGNNTSPAGTFNSSSFTVTSRFYRFFGPNTTTPANSAEVRALSSSAFYTGSTTFILNTGSTETKFVIVLPPGVTITQVLDLDALNANITSEYILLGTINVLDAGGTNRSYNLYEMNIGAPYSSNHQHSVTIS